MVHNKLNLKQLTQTSKFGVNYFPLLNSGMTVFVSDYFQNLFNK